MVIDGRPKVGLYVKNQNEAEITKQLSDIQQELDVVKMRVSMHLGKKKK